MLFLENEVLLEAALMALIESHHPDRVKMVLCKFASRIEKLTYLILKVCLKSAPYSLNRVKPQGKPLLSNLFSGFSALLWKSRNRGAYLMLVLLQQWLKGSVERLFILHVLSMLCPGTSCVEHMCLSSLVGSSSWWHNLLPLFVQCGFSNILSAL